MFPTLLEANANAVATFKDNLYTGGDSLIVYKNCSIALDNPSKVQVKGIKQLEVFDKKIYILLYNEIQIYDLDLNFESTVCRLEVEINYFDVDSKGLAIASDESAVSIYKGDVVKRLECKKPASRLAFSKVSPFLITTLTDGSLNIWLKGSSDWILQQSLFEAPLRSSLDYYNVAWNPAGTHLAMCANNSEVRIVRKADWKVCFTLSHVEDICHVSFSPNGVYILTLGFKKSMYLWRPEENRQKPCWSYLHTERICLAKWSQSNNALSLVTESGGVAYWDLFVKNHLPHPVAGFPKSTLDQPDSYSLFGAEENSDIEEDNTLGSTEAKSRKNHFKGNKMVDDEAMDDDDDELGHRRKPRAKMSIEEEENIEDLENAIFDEIDDYEDMKNFVVDDDGGGYLEDLQDPRQYEMYQKRTQKEALNGLKKDVAERFESNPLAPAQELQPCLQPGSTPFQGNRRYLTFNLIGAVCSIDSGTHHTIDVTFHDQSIRPFHFTDHNQFKLACLDYHGAIFCSEATSILPSIISYHPVDTWQKNDWTIELPLGESCEAVAMNNTCIIVATTMNFLRLFSISGIQIGIKSLSGPILSMAGSGASIIIAYHSGSAFNGFSNSSYFILDTETMTTTLTGSLALSPSATLSWIGFSKTGIPITYDSVGILRGLLVNQDQSWTPFLDARRLELLEGDCCWAVGVTATHFMCVLVRGAKFPSFPVPLIHDFPIQLPLAQMDLETSKLEEKMLLGRILEGEKSLGSLSEDVHINQMDKHALHLILYACKEEKALRALDLCRMLGSLQSIEGAIKIAVHHRMPALAEKMSIVRQHKHREILDSTNLTDTFKAPIIQSEPVVHREEVFQISESKESDNPDLQTEDPSEAVADEPHEKLVQESSPLFTSSKPLNPFERAIPKPSKPTTNKIFEAIQMAARGASTGDENKKRKQTLGTDIVKLSDKRSKGGDPAPRSIKDHFKKVMVEPVKENILPNIAVTAALVIEKQTEENVEISSTAIEDSGQITQ